VSQWRYYNPVEVRFGPDVLAQVGAAIGSRRWILVTHPDAPMMVWRDKLLASSSAPLMVLDAIEPNPSLAMLDALCAGLADVADQIDVIVALGGGSVMDTAKFLAAGHGQYAPVKAYLEGEAALEQSALPIIAIPTTAGTGSELTKWATIWDPAQGRKLSLNSDDLYAEAAFIDPLITGSLPWSITLASGLDALSHALESLWNINANPLTRSYAVAAAKDVLAALPKLQVNLGNADARAILARGAMRAGLAFSNTMTALAHNISYPITLDHGVPHGIACSFCLPEVMLAAVGVDAECDAALAEIFGDTSMAPKKLRDWLDDLGVAAQPQHYGISDSEWQTIVSDAFAGPRGRNFLGRADHFPAATIR
jgi:alcohol dehydrogenase